VRLSRLARVPRYVWLLVVAALLLAGSELVRLESVSAASARPDRHRAHAERARRLTSSRATHWVAAWGASPQPATSRNESADGFADQTIRNIVFSSIGGPMVRVELTNSFGLQPLEIGQAAIGVQAAGASVAPGTNQALSFSGSPSVLIPPGAEALSDPVRLTVVAKQHLAVSVFVPRFTGPATQHADAQQVTYVSGGDRALDASAGAFTVRTHSWDFVDSVDVLSSPANRGAVVALGDSITDGVGSPINANARWPNDLARRLDAHGGARLSVIDEGIGGNRVLNDAICCGMNAVARFDSDVVAQSDVREVILLEGINDIGFSQHHGPLSAPHTNVSAAQIIAGYEQIIGQAHAAGLKIFGGTLTPFKGAAYWTPAGEAKREAVNQWIRTSGAFDGVINFARAVADPGNPEILRPAYDSGDHLHPDAAGYRAMANAISLPMLLNDA
jgi:lysophospholipase L1-like esterase